ncbi:MAG: response regulator [Candidatus Marinimicrobia bacterium]|nr:response regulator [Candidatus Neomarinimicrobiota bacterium]
MHKKYFTTGEIARYCEVDINTVKNWIKANDLEGFKTPSGHFRVARKAFIDFINKQGFTFDPVYFGSDSNELDILLVDDDQTHLELMMYHLDKFYPDKKILYAKNGFDGYSIMHEKKPRLVLLDLVMPIIDGVEFIKVMRSNKKLDKIRLIVISAHLDKSTLKKLKKIHVDFFLEKPVNEKEIKEACDVLLNSNMSGRTTD